jgi:hypothetical protein
MVLESYTIDDDLASQTRGAIEVTLKLKGLNPRWCYFMCPEALAACGDRIPGTMATMHLGWPHMIVVACEITLEIIDRVLREIDSQGALERCSLPVDGYSESQFGR